MNIAIVGITGAVGKIILDLLESRNFKYNNIYGIASENSSNIVIKSKKGTEIEVQCINDFDFKKVDLVLSSTPNAIAAQFIPKAIDCKCIIIDNSSYFRMHEDILLIIPEINGDLLKNITKGCVIANPNCSTIQMVMALYPIYKSYGIKDVIVSTYQSISGAGNKAIDSFLQETQKALNDNNYNNVKGNAFNIVPQIDKILNDGRTKEEWKMEVETIKIIGDTSITIHANCARVPTINCHAEYINIELKKIFII